MSVQPAIAARVRRYVSSDIGKILGLARKASDRVGIAYEEDRLKFVLENNVRNVFLCCFVLVDLIEVVGVLVAQTRKSITSKDTIADMDLFYIEPDYEIDLILADYVNWAKERGCTDVRSNDMYMTGVLKLPSFSVRKEAL